MSTVLTNGIIIPDNGSRNWGGDLANNWNIIDLNVGYMTDVKNRVTTLENSVTSLENSVAENTANIQTNASNISALQTSKQDVIADLETIRSGATAGATAVQPSELNNYYTKAETDTALTSKANNDAVVHKSGNEVISGIKNFNNVFLGEEDGIIRIGQNVEGALFCKLYYDGRIYNNSKQFVSTTDNEYNLGTSTHRWKDIYATNATINTSDRNAKTDIKIIDDNILEAWDKVSLVSFKFKDAVEKKGDDARTHTGYIAQNIKEELNNYGIDACRYGLFCYNSWDAQEEKSHEEERTAEKGNTKTIKVIDAPAIEAGETYGLRYIECLVVECAYLRKKNKKLEDRITKLEEILKDRSLI